VVSQAGGTWGNAEEVPFSGQLNTGGAAVLESVSCDAAGDCNAGGYYTDSSGLQQAFVVREAGGLWGQAEEIPITTQLNASNAQIDSVSCARGSGNGNCSAGGQYIDSSGRFQVFVVNQVNGTWSNAVEVPGTAGLNTGGSAGLESVSCASAGNCSAGGEYTDSSGHVQAFVANEVNETWINAVEVPNTNNLNTGGNARVNSVSCASAGNCSAGGWYTTSSGFQQAFVVSEVNGTWGQAKLVPNTAKFNTGGSAGIDSVSCRSAGHCSAGGYYWGSSGFSAFVVSQAAGFWGHAEKVPGMTALNTGGNAGIDSVSCGAVGNCSAGGTYRDSSGHHQAFVDSQARGIWSQAEEVPGTNS
jgi:hypothetical protein